MFQLQAGVCKRNEQAKLTIPAVHTLSTRRGFIVQESFCLLLFLSVFIKSCILFFEENDEHTVTEKDMNIRRPSM